MIFKAMDIYLGFCIKGGEKLQPPNCTHFVSLSLSLCLKPQW